MLLQVRFPFRVQRGAESQGDKLWHNRKHDQVAQIDLGDVRIVRDGKSRTSRRLKALSVKSPAIEQALASVDAVPVIVMLFSIGPLRNICSTVGQRGLGAVVGELGR